MGVIGGNCLTNDIAEQVKHIAEQVRLLENRLDSPMYGPMLEENEDQS